MKPLSGIHHVTAITADAQRNLNFYSGVLGLRLVKKTVNFDDPSSYHLYYGDRVGTPGTLLTFFAWPGAPRGTRGTGEPAAFALAVPAGSLPFWSERLAPFSQTAIETGMRFDQPFLAILDPDGLRVELIESSAPVRSQFWPEGGIPESFAITGVHSVTLHLASTDKSAAVYANGLTFNPVGKADDGRQRFAIGTDGGRGFVDLIAPVAPAFRAEMGSGTIHHLAFRTPDDETQREWLGHLGTLGLHSSSVMDRNYFHSIYFREPGHVLFEIATDPPGMTVDEPEAELGESLKLPQQYESSRSRLERILAPLSAPQLSRI